MSYLPSIVKQVGNITGQTRVYIEDYVSTYLNEMKKNNEGSSVRVALYGHASRADGNRYYFIYGASCVVEELENGREQEQIKEEYFKDFDLIGYVNIYKKTDFAERKDGYYIFYENNEAMQNYLLSCYQRQQKRAFAGLGWKKVRGGFWKNFLMKIMLCGLIIAISVAVITISDYDKMNDFARMMFFAIQESGKIR